MRMIEKIKKLFKLSERCSTCKNCGHLYDRSGYCVRDFPPPPISPITDCEITDCEHVCSLYEKKEKE